MLPLAKRYFYQSLNKQDPDDDDRHDDDDDEKDDDKYDDGAFPTFLISKYNLSQLVSCETRVIRENETKHATWVTNF